MEYVVIFEEDEKGCSAYVPDLPGCVAAGDTLEEVKVLISEGIRFHIEGIRASGAVVPRPSLVFDVPIPNALGVSFELIRVRDWDVSGQQSDKNGQ